MHRRHWYTFLVAESVYVNQFGVHLVEWVATAGLPLSLSLQPPTIIALSFKSLGKRTTMPATQNDSQVSATDRCRRLLIRTEDHILII